MTCLLERGLEASFLLPRQAHPEAISSRFSIGKLKALNDGAFALPNRRVDGWLSQSLRLGKSQGLVLAKRRRQLSCIASSANSALDLSLEHFVLGVDVGGTSIKAAPVDTRHGTLSAERHVIMTPKPASPEAVADVVRQMTEHFKWKGPVGVGLPSVVQKGIVRTAANVDKRWIGTDAESLFKKATGLQVVACNDADAAAYAEMGFGAGKGNYGVVFILTFGTGIGTAMFVDGILVPNLELGHIELAGLGEGEKYANGVLRETLGLTWEAWAARASAYMSTIEALFWPDLFIVGGGVSNASEEWIPRLTLPAKTPVVPAQMRNDAGIVGAAMASVAREASKVMDPVQVEDVIR